MYRATSIISHSRTMYYRPSFQIKLRAVSCQPPLQKYGSPTERETCPPPPPPPPPPPKDERLFWGVMGMLVVTGGFAFFAQQNPDVRDWLTLHAPWFDDFIAVVYQENMTYREFAESCYDDVMKYLNSYFDDKKQSEPCALDGGDNVIADEPDKEEPEIVISKCDENVEKPKCEVLPPPVITKDICEVEACLKDLHEEIINNYLTAKEACAYYNRLVEETMLNFNLSQLPNLHAALAERRDLVQTSLCNVNEATTKVEKLIRYLDCGVQAPKEAIANTQAMIKDNRDKITAANMQYQWENDKSIALESQVAKVEALVTQFTDENQTMFSGLRYDDKKPVLNGDADLLLYHTFRYAQKLQVQLCEASEAMTQRVDRALETLPQTEKELKARCYLIQSEVKKKRGEMEKDFNKRLAEQAVNNEKALREALKKQLERHEENLQNKLAQKEKEATAKLSKMVAEKVESEKRVFSALLTDMAAKLKVVENKLNARLKAERESRRSQELWAAGSALLAATKKGVPSVNVEKELKAIEKASGDDDKLVKTVMKAIPESIRTNGLVPESVLKERYYRMEKVALGVALVDAEGAPLPVFVLSWLQSLLLFMRLSSIPQIEADKPPKEASKDLDSFDKLQRARYWLERGNLALTVRYVDALQGASRSMAQGWLESARAHLETRQAAEAVLAHAAALGLQYL